MFFPKCGETLRDFGWEKDRFVHYRSPLQKFILEKITLDKQRGKKHYFILYKQTILDFEESMIDI